MRATGDRDDAGGSWISSSPKLVSSLAAADGSIGSDTPPPVDSAQWIKNIDTDGDGDDDHVYGRLRRHVVSITGRRRTRLPAT